MTTNQVMAVFLAVIQVTRNPDMNQAWPDLRAELCILHRVLVAVGSVVATVQIVVDVLVRGGRLTTAPFSGEAIFNMFTNLLGSEHGVANAVFNADVNRCRKTQGGVTALGLLGGNIPAPFLPVSTGLSAISILLAVGPLTISQPPRLPGPGAVAVTLPLAHGTGTGHYTPAAPGGGYLPPNSSGRGGGGGGGGRGRDGRGGARGTGIPPPDRRRRRKGPGRPGRGPRHRRPPARHDGQPIPDDGGRSERPERSAAATAAGDPRPPRRRAVPQLLRRRTRPAPRPPRLCVLDLQQLQAGRPLQRPLP